MQQKKKNSERDEAWVWAQKTSEKGDSGDGKGVKIGIKDWC